MKYKSKRINKRFEITDFCTAFHFEWDESFVFHGESHEIWEIVFLRAGKVEVTEDENIYTLEKNNLIVHAPMEFHRIRSADGTMPRGYVLTFSAFGSLPTSLKSGIFVLEDAEADQYETIAKKIMAFIREQDENDYTGQEVADLLSAFLIHLGNKKIPEKRLTLTASAIEYKKAITVMTERICDNISLSDIAAECNISVSYLKLLFKQYAGISPKSYYINLRVQHASTLLKHGLSSAEIASDMNFSSPNYFSVFFKKNTGISPLEYRRSQG